MLSTDGFPTALSLAVGLLSVVILVYGVLTGNVLLGVLVPLILVLLVVPTYLLYRLVVAVERIADVH
ncbi:hypothetical protein [Natronorarus salvus]|uniref:hypothetical protein n=1 Tax=Natronorarus salvus TaxID=3117733 RepID=UPI002F2639F9